MVVEQIKMKVTTFITVSRDKYIEKHKEELTDKLIEHYPDMWNRIVDTHMEEEDEEEV